MPTDFKPRFLPDVIADVIKLIPSNDPKDMLHHLESIRQSSLYTPPEGQQLWWQAFCMFLESTMTYPPVEKWERDVYKLVTMKEPPFDDVKIK